MLCTQSRVGHAEMSERLVKSGYVTEVTGSKVSGVLAQSGDGGSGMSRAV